MLLLLLLLGLAIAERPPFPAQISYTMRVRNGIDGADPYNFTAQCSGTHSTGRWFWRHSSSDFRLDCHFPQPDPNQDCQLMYSWRRNVWKYKTPTRNSSTFHYDELDKPPDCTWDNEIDDHTGNGAFGSVYPFVFPATSTLNASNVLCPDGSSHACQLWVSPLVSAADLPYHVYWWVRNLPGQHVSLPVRAVLMLQYDGPVPLCLDFSEVDDKPPPESDFEAPRYCQKTPPGERAVLPKDFRRRVRSLRL